MAGPRTPDPGGKRQTFAIAVLVVSTWLVMTANGGMFLLVVSLKQMAGDFGWPRSVPSLAYAFFFAGAGIGGIVMGWWYDRSGAGPVTLLGLTMIGIGAMLVSAVDSRWQLYLVFGVMLGLLGYASIYGPLTINVMRWFRHRPGFAVGVVTAGEGLGGTIWPPVFRYFNETAAGGNGTFHYRARRVIAEAPECLDEAPQGRGSAWSTGISGAPACRYRRSASARTTSATALRPCSPRPSSSVRSMPASTSSTQETSTPGVRAKRLSGGPCRQRAPPRSPHLNQDRSRTPQAGRFARRARPANAAERPGELAAQHHPRLRAVAEGAPHRLRRPSPGAPLLPPVPHRGDPGGAHRSGPPGQGALRRLLDVPRLEAAAGDHAERGERSCPHGQRGVSLQPPRPAEIVCNRVEVDLEPGRTQDSCDGRSSWFHPSAVFTSPSLIPTFSAAARMSSHAPSESGRPCSRRSTIVIRSFSPGTSTSSPGRAGRAAFQYST